MEQLTILKAIKIDDCTTGVVSYRPEFNCFGYQLTRNGNQIDISTRAMKEFIDFLSRIKTTERCAFYDYEWGTTIRLNKIMRQWKIEFKCYGGDVICFRLYTAECLHLKDKLVSLQHEEKQYNEEAVRYS